MSEQQASTFKPKKSVALSGVTAGNTALCTVGTFVYNLCSDLVGGVEVTLSERD